MAEILTILEYAALWHLDLLACSCVDDDRPAKSDVSAEADVTDDGEVLKIVHVRSLCELAVQVCHLRVLPSAKGWLG
jgi:hypothetical protein